MRFNEFRPLVEFKQRPQLPKNRRQTRTVKPVQAAPTAPATQQAPAQQGNPFGSMAASLAGPTPNQPAPEPTTTQAATSTGGVAQTTTNPDGTTSTTHIANPNNPNITKPSLLNRIGNSLTKAFDFSKQGKIDSQAQKIFIDKFNKTLDYNAQSAQQNGMKFNLRGFVDGYMARNHWNPGQFKQQLDHAVASNDRRTIPTIMAQIGKANTAMYSPTREPEIAGAFGNAPAQAQPATQQAPAQTATAQPQHSISLDGKPLDPSDPTTAKIMAMLQQQGKL